MDTESDREGAADGPARTMHSVRAAWSPEGWTVEVVGFGSFRTRSAAGIPARAEAMIAERNGTAEPGVAVRYVPEDRVLERLVRSAGQSVADAHRAQERSAEFYRRTIRHLRERGMNGRDIARVLGVTPQRVSQLLKEPVTPGDGRQRP